MGSWKCTARFRLASTLGCQMAQKGQEFRGRAQEVRGKVTNPTTPVFRTLKQNKGAAEVFRILSQPVDPGRISQALRSEKEEKTSWNRPNFSTGNGDC